MLIPRRYFLSTLGSLSAAVFTPSILRAASKKPKPPTPAPAGDAPKEKALSQLRLWKATDAVQQPVGVRLLLPGRPDSGALTPLRIDPQEYQFSSYADVPAGAVTIEVSAPGQTPIRLPGYLAPAGQTTLVVRFQNAKLSAEWIDDTPAPAGSGCVFRICNLLPASGDIEVTLGTILDVHLPSVRSSVYFSEIKPELYPITVKGTEVANKPFNSNLDLDFGQCRRATLIICPDAYGRIRPRVNAS